MQTLLIIWRCFASGRVGALRHQWFQRLSAASGLLLIGATWRLWTPQTDFPQVPLIAPVAAWPAWFGWLGLIVIVASLLTALLAVGKSRGRRPALLLFAAAVVFMAMLDQHRLQPWAYQLAITAIVLAAREPTRAFALLRLLVVSIYVYSSLGKFDYQFLNSVGSQFLTTAADWIGVNAGGWTAQTRALLAVFFPLGELAVAMLLIFPRTRRAGVVAALMLHGGLLLLLGPWGLNHEAGVLLWNVYFAAQAVLLFWPERDAAPAETPAPASERAAHRPAIGRVGVAELLIGCVVVAPLLEPAGWCDHWLAWGLYSPRNSRVVVLVRRSAWDRLPSKLRGASPAAGTTEAWKQVDLSRWSLDTLAVPIYPQARFQLGVALALADHADLDRDIQVELLGMSNRLTGHRQVSTLRGRHELQMATERFFWNARPNGRLQ